MCMDLRDGKLDGGAVQIYTCVDGNVSLHIGRADARPTSSGPYRPSHKENAVYSMQRYAAVTEVPRRVKATDPGERQVAPLLHPGALLYRCMLCGHECNGHCSTPPLAFRPPLALT